MHAANTHIITLHINYIHYVIIHSKVETVEKCDLLLYGKSVDRKHSTRSNDYNVMNHRTLVRVRACDSVHQNKMLAMLAPALLLVGASLADLFVAEHVKPEVDMDELARNHANMNGTLGR